jgi:Fe-S-cluster containining protein
MPVIEFREQVDDLAARAQEQHGGAACSHCTKPTCCWQQVQAYGSEVADVAEAIKDNEPLKERLRQWVQTFMVLPKKAQLKAEHYFALRRPCPFLVAGRCSIYERRPIACRTHFSFEETPDNCDPDKVGIGHRVTQLDTFQMHAQFLAIEGTVNFGLGVMACLEPESKLGRMAYGLANYLTQEQHEQDLRTAQARRPGCTRT